MVSRHNRTEMKTISKQEMQAPEHYPCIHAHIPEITIKVSAWSIWVLPAAMESRLRGTIRSVHLCKKSQWVTHNSLFQPTNSQVHHPPVSRRLGQSHIQSISKVHTPDIWVPVQYMGSNTRLRCSLPLHSLLYCQHDSLRCPSAPDPCLSTASLLYSSSKKMAWSTHRGTKATYPSSSSGTFTRSSCTKLKNRICVLIFFLTK